MSAWVLGLPWLLDVLRPPCSAAWIHTASCVHAGRGTPSWWRAVAGQSCENLIEGKCVPVPRRLNNAQSPPADALHHVAIRGSGVGVALLAGQRFESSDNISSTVGGERRTGEKPVGITITAGHDSSRPGGNRIDTRLLSGKLLAALVIGRRLEGE